MALTPRAAHVLQCPVQREARLRSGANPQSRAQFRLKSAIRLHEAGIASNRGSECHGEYVPGSCTHRPSSHESRSHPKYASLTVRRQHPKVRLVIGTKS